MGRRTTRFAEIVVRIVPSRDRSVEPQGSEATEKEPGGPRRTYDALIYSDLKIPHLDPASLEPSSDRPQAIAELPLAGREQVVIRWGKYTEYITAFVAGEKAAYGVLRKLLPYHRKAEDQSTDLARLRSALFEAPTPGLGAILKGELTTDRPLRVWWSSPAPELAQLPWELFAYGVRGGADRTFSFVRGVPTTTVPRVPVFGRLRVALVHDPQRTPAALIAAFDDLKAVPELEVIPMTEPPLQAIQRAVREDVELIHLVADGMVSLAHEGILYLRKSSSATKSQISPQTRRALRVGLNLATSISSVVPAPWIDWLSDKVYSQLDIETCAPGQLSAILRGSRVTVLSLTPPTTDDTQPERLTGFLLPSVYQAFAGLGGSAVPLPNLVAPLGATSDAQLRKFWRDFYTHLAKSHSVEEALAEGQQGGPILPMALFLRQRSGREFLTMETASTAAVNPRRIRAELEASRELLDQLKAVDSKYKNLDDNVTSAQLVHRESARQTEVEHELETWTDLKDGEQ